MDTSFEKKVAQFYLSKSQSCRKRGIAFELSLMSVRNLLRAKRCYYTGVPLTRYNGKAQRPTDITIDRVDSSKGYVRGNVVACCQAANSYKSVFENSDTLNFSHLVKMSKRLAR